MRTNRETVLMGMVSRLLFARSGWTLAGGVARTQSVPGSLYTGCTACLRATPASGPTLDLIASELPPHPASVGADVPGRQMVEGVGDRVGLAQLTGTAANHGLVHISQHHVLHQVVI